MSALTKQGKESNKIIPKAELKDGHYYIAKTFQRGMPIGLWCEEDDTFRCLHEAGFGEYEVYKMEHDEDVRSGLCFEPVKEIIL